LADDCGAGGWAYPPERSGPMARECAERRQSRGQSTVVAACCRRCSPVFHCSCLRKRDLPHRTIKAAKIYPSQRTRGWGPPLSPRPV